MFKSLRKWGLYMGKRKGLLPLSLVLSGLSSLLGMVPFVLIWLIVGKLLLPEGEMFVGVDVVACGWWACGMAIGSLLLNFGALMVSHLVAFRVESNMRRSAMEKVMEMPLGFFNKNTMGKMRKVIDDNATITHTFLAHELPDLMGTIVAPLVILVLLFVFNWQLGLACLVPIVIAMISVNLMMGKEGMEYMKQYMSSMEDMNTEGVEYVRGIPVVKIFHQTIYSFKNFYQSIVNYNKMVTAYTMLCKVPMTIYTVVINGFAFFLIPIAIMMMGNMDNWVGVLVDFIFFIIVTPFIAQSIMRSMYLESSRMQADEALTRMEKMVDYELMKVPEVGVKPERFDIEFEHVGFAYEGSDKRAVDDVSFKVLEGQRVALVGPSGSGKTTLARLLPKFWLPQEGRVMIGGVDVQTIAKEELMRDVAFVFQNVKLFKTTLRENIMFGNGEATEEELQRAIDAAQCREIIDRLPMGLETKIGVEGTYLSGGEQQRIVLARAILKDAPIVVLDEATAFADPENEALIQEGLRELAKGKTVLMIAHRLTSVMDADMILVVDEGKIVERGQHNELVEKGGLYAKMWNDYCKSINWTIGRKGVRK